MRQRVFFIVHAGFGAVGGVGGGRAERITTGAAQPLCVSTARYTIVV